MTRIPLDAAHECLVAFGITKRTREYDRWVKDDGFDLVDFLQVLADSPYIYCFDWRCDLTVELPDLAENIAGHGIHLEFEFINAGDAGHAICDGKRAPFAGTPNDENELDGVIRAIQRVIPNRFEFRAETSNEENDQAVYAVLAKEDWAKLAAAAPEFIAETYPPDRALS